MSWDADLIASDVDGNAHTVREWNYTHNCNGMASAVIDRFRPNYAREIALKKWSGTGQKRGRTGPSGELEWSTVEDDEQWKASWWDILGTLGGLESIEFLDLIIGTMMEMPEFFREMNPENGWGDYDSFLGVLVEMRATAASHPSAKWETSG